MFTFISSRFSLEAIPSNFLPTNLSDVQWKYAKITLVVLSVFSALAAVVSIYRCYQAKESKSEESVIPVHVSPKSPHGPKTDVSPKKPDLTQKEQDDAKLAEQIQNQMNQDVDADAELARKLQAQFDAEEEEPQPVITSPKKPFPPKPKDLSPVLPPKVDTPPIPKPVKEDSPSKDPQPVKPSPFTQIEKISNEISEKAFTDPKFSAVKALKAVDPKTHKQVLDLLNEIIAEFERRYPVTQKVAYQSQVPTYFANVATEKSDDRKYLSLVGIRNLLAVGPQIIDDFRDTKFLGGEHHYWDFKGLKAFKYYTGNLVDLDTEIEAKDDNEARKIARERIVKFGQICGFKKPGLTAEDVALALPGRKLEIDNFFIPESTSNTDRSNCGLWKRLTVTTTGSKYHYYINVPQDCDLVILATLKLPYIIADLAYRTKEKNGGKLTKEFFDEFFEKGVSDKCYNDKARTFMAFDREWSDKLNGVLSIEEDARRKIEKGTFGSAIQKKGAAVALKEAYHIMTLSNFLDQFNFECNRRPFDQWLKEDGPKIRKILVDKGLFESTLYHSNEESEYFLLDDKTLNLFLRSYHTYLKTMD